MKTSELFEARTALPDWVKAEDDVFKTLVKRYGLICRQQPQLVKGRWVFGGELKDTSTHTISVKLETRVVGLQKALAKHLFDIHQQGREVVTYDISHYGGFSRTGYWRGSYSYIKDVNPRYLYKDDTLKHVEDRVKDKLFVNNWSGGRVTIAFQYGIENKDPAPPAKAEPEKKIYRVVKGGK